MKGLIFTWVKYLPIVFLPTLKKNLCSPQYSQNQEIQTSIERLYLSPFEVSLSEFKVFQLDSGQLGKQVAAHLDTGLGGISSQKFNDGQCNVQVLDSIRGHNVYLIKRFRNKQINDGIIELLIAVNTLKKQGAAKVTCFIPFFPYSQSVDFHVEEEKNFFTCFGSDILKMLEDAGCDRVITFNSLMAAPKGFVNSCTFMNINAPDLFVGHLATKHLKDPILVSSYINTPNVNNLHILKEALGHLNFHCPISTFNQNDYIGEDVKGRDIVLYSNIMRTGNTFVKLSKILKQKGARNIYGCAFHSLATEKQMQNVDKNSYLKQLLTTNSLPHNQYSKRIKTTSLSRIIAQIITLFEEEKPLNEYRIQLQRKKIDFIRHIKHTNRTIQSQFRAQEIL